MRKFMNETKATLGLAPKTEDPDFDAKSQAIKDVEQAIRDYNTSVDKMKSTALSVATSLQQVAKAFDVLVKQDGISDSIKEISKCCDLSTKKIHDDDVDTYKTALEGDVVSSMKDLKDLVEECKKLETARGKVMNEYDTYRDNVSKKEAEYAKKGKDLSDSKNYKEDVSKRDEYKQQFEEADKQYKKKSDEVEKKKKQIYLDSMKAFTTSTEKFFASVHKNMDAVHGKCDKAKI